MTLPTLTPRAHREQAVFRTLLNTMARPGIIGRLDAIEGDVLLRIAESLVDHEVTFGVLPERADFVDTVLRQTGSRQASVETADYVFCEPESLAGVLLAVKDGTPEYPDRSATVICRVPRIAEEGAGLLVLSGPGIREQARVCVPDFTLEARNAFTERNALPPLGIDLVLASPDGRVVCLSRYTRMERED